MVISHDNEIIPILDNFIKEHEDFSLHGAKGIIGLTVFASHSYGHPDVKK